MPPGKPKPKPPQSTERPGRLIAIDPLAKAGKLVTRPLRALRLTRRSK